MMPEVPLLVQVVSGNPATSAAILLSLNIHDALIVRQLHPVLLHTVAGVPCCEMETTVHDLRRWRAALPSAVGARVTPRLLVLDDPTLLAGLTALDLRQCTAVTDAVIQSLPSTLRRLNVHHCGKLTLAASFTHLPSLLSLNCSYTAVLSMGLEALPPSLQELHMDGNELCPVPLPAERFRHLRALRVLSWMYGASSHATLPSTLEELDISHSQKPWVVAAWARFPRLRVVRAQNTPMTNASAAALPASLEELDVSGCRNIKPTVSFAHLCGLRTLCTRDTAIGDATLASLPPSLVSLNVSQCKLLSAGATLPGLPALQVLDAGNTSIGDALVGSLPPCLTTLRVANCASITPTADMRHLAALRELQCSGTSLPLGTVAALRARGCFAPAELVRQQASSADIQAMAVWADGRLVAGDTSSLAVWSGVGAAAALVPAWHDEPVATLAALPDARLAVALHTANGKAGCIEVWNTHTTPPTRCAAIATDNRVCATALLLDGRLAAGCADGRILLVDVASGTVGGKPTLRHAGGVTALAVLPDGALASCADDITVRVWDVDRGVGVALLVGEPRFKRALAVLPSGHLASAAADGTVWLWDVATSACYVVLTPARPFGTVPTVATMVALPDGRLACGDSDGAVRVWDTHAYSPSRDGDVVIRERAAARAVVRHVMLEGHAGRVGAMALLPDGRLVSGGRGGVLRIWRLPPPLANP